MGTVFGRMKRTMLPKKMFIFAVKIIFLVSSWSSVEGSVNEPPIQNPLQRGDQGTCPNHFAQFFHQISQRTRWAASQDDSADIDHPAWPSSPFQLFELSELLKGLNGSAEEQPQPDPTPSPKFKCGSNYNDIQNGSRGVIMVNSSELVHLISRRPNVSAIVNSSIEASSNSTNNSSKHSESVCVVVMFFATSCRFSAATAPHYNAFGRAMSGLDVLAFDINQANGVNSRYGIVAVPSIILFHNGKLAARFNESQRTLESMMNFVHNLTGLPVNNSVQVSEEDQEGPVPTTAVIGPDYFLWFSNTFLFLCGLGLLQQKVGAAVRAKITAIQDYIIQVWRTGEFYEQVGIADNDQEPMNNDAAEIR
ncbi:uncharacterized protein LOC121432260 [Lytechinus variegatus]|uniref:uncharacterized protein LOC121432260 n=1 Tax=Lytechinus variegatus TaxID=7654 RepID=UPI001BB12871|nr:uncharacterized protein LOC121432260 [Lytechinus variegatus]